MSAQEADPLQSHKLVVACESKDEQEQHVSMDHSRETCKGMMGDVGFVW